MRNKDTYKNKMLSYDSDCYVAFLISEDYYKRYFIFLKLR